MSNFSEFPQCYFDTVKDYPAWLIATAFFVPFVGGTGIYLYKTRHARSWRKGIYPPKLKLTEDNLLEAYLALGSLLILLDYKASKDKTKYINSYFNRYFVKSNYNFGDSLVFSMRHPIKIDSVSDWLAQHLVSEGERAQVIYFLTGLAMLDGTLSQRELQFLEVINRKLGLAKENLERVISIYSEYKAQNKSTEDKRSRQPKKPSEAHRYAAILHLSLQPSLVELKKRYRALAKEHHPDRFSQSSEAQQRLAQATFQEIQAAYEFWLKKLTV